MCAQVLQIQIKHISNEVSLDGCRMPIVIISYKTCWIPNIFQHLAGFGVVFVVFLLPSSENLISNELSMDSASGRCNGSEQKLILFLFSTVYLSFCAKLL